MKKYLVVPYTLRNDVQKKAHAYTVGVSEVLTDGVLAALLNEERRPTSKEQQVLRSIAPFCVTERTIVAEHAPNKDRTVVLLVPQGSSLTKSGIEDVLGRYQLILNMLVFS